MKTPHIIMSKGVDCKIVSAKRRGQMMTKDDEGGREVSKTLTIAHQGGKGFRQMMTIDDEGVI